MRILIVMAWGALLAPLPVSAQSLEESRTALRTGSYEAAVRGFRRAVDAQPEATEARRGWVEALVTLGRLEEAEGVARSGTDPGSMANTLGEVLLARGRIAEAKQAFQQAGDAEATPPR